MLVPDPEPARCDDSSTYTASFHPHQAQPLPTSPSQYAWLASPHKLDSATTYKDIIGTTAAAEPLGKATVPQSQILRYPGLHVGDADRLDGSTVYNKTYRKPDTSTVEQMPIAGALAATSGTGQACEDLVTSTGAQLRRYKLQPNTHHLEGPSVYKGDFRLSSGSAGNLRCDNQWTRLLPNPYILAPVSDNYRSLLDGL